MVVFGGVENTGEKQDQCNRNLCKHFHISKLEGPYTLAKTQSPALHIHWPNETISAPREEIHRFGIILSFMYVFL